LIFKVLSKTPVADQAAVKAKLDTLVTTGAKLSDIRALSQGQPTSGGVTLATVFEGTSVADPTEVQLDANEVSTAATTAVTQVQTAVVNAVKELAKNTDLNAAQKTAAIQKLAPDATLTAIEAIVNAAPEDVEQAVIDNAETAIQTNVATTGGLATIADTTVEVRVVTDAYGAL
jgi:hypothetical protein